MALRKSQTSLVSWTRQEWGYLNPDDENKPRAKRGRYLPKSVRENMTPSQKARENAKKRKASKKGKQYASYSKSTAKKVNRASR